LKKGSPWLYHYRATAKHTPSRMLTKSLSLFENEPPTRRRRLGVDLGCGGGRDTLEMLRRGWRVLAVDGEPEIVHWVSSRTPAQYRDRLRTRVAKFEKVKLPKCDLVNASYCLPFCAPDQFASLWTRIALSIRSGGRFAGHLFGKRDDWAGDVDKTFHTNGQVRRLLSNFIVEFFQEREEDGRTGSGKKKHWHVFSVVARKV